MFSLKTLKNRLVSCRKKKKADEKPYFLFLSSDKVFPFMYGLAQVNAVHGDFDLSDYIMFTKAVKVKHLQDQSLPC